MWNYMFWKQFWRAKTTWVVCIVCLCFLKKYKKIKTKKNHQIKKKKKKWNVVWVLSFMADWLRLDGVFAAPQVLCTASRGHGEAVSSNSVELSLCVAWVKSPSRLPSVRTGRQLQHLRRLKLSSCSVSSPLSLKSDLLNCSPGHTDRQRKVGRLSVRNGGRGAAAFSPKTARLKSTAKAVRWRRNSQWT